MPKKTLRCISHCRLSGFFYFQKLQCEILPCGICILSAVCKLAISTKITARNIWTWLRHLSAGVDYWPSVHCVLYVSYRIWSMCMGIQLKFTMKILFLLPRQANKSCKQWKWSLKKLFFSVFPLNCFDESLRLFCNDKMSPSKPFFSSRVCVWQCMCVHSQSS